MVKTPPSGGDTVFTNLSALFDKLSPRFQQALEGLHARHSADFGTQASSHIGIY